MNVINEIFRRILLFIYKKPEDIPPITHSIYMLSATALAKKIRQRDVSHLLHFYSDIPLCII